MTQFARFAKESGKISENGAKWKLFEPDNKSRTSVFDITGCSDQKICELGVKHVAKPNKKNLHGWAILNHTDYEQLELNIVPDNDPPGHANVIWPKDSEQRKRRYAKLLRLVRDSIKIVPSAKTCADCGKSDFVFVPRQPSP